MPTATKTGGRTGAVLASALLLLALAIGNTMLAMDSSGAMSEARNGFRAFLSSFLIQVVISCAICVLMTVLCIRVFRRRHGILLRALLLGMTLLAVVLPLVAWFGPPGAKRDAFEVVWAALGANPHTEEVVVWARQVLESHGTQGTQGDLAVAQETLPKGLNISFGGQPLFPSARMVRDLADDNIFIAINYYGGRAARFGYFIGSTNFVLPPNKVKQARIWKDGVYVFLDAD